jgi:hypothetical protein
MAVGWKCHQAHSSRATVRSRVHFSALRCRRAKIFLGIGTNPKGGQSLKCSQQLCYSEVEGTYARIVAGNPVTESNVGVTLAPRINRAYKEDKGGSDMKSLPRSPPRPSSPEDRRTSQCAPPLVYTCSLTQPPPTSQMGRSNPQRKDPAISRSPLLRWKQRNGVLLPNHSEK